MKRKLLALAVFSAMSTSALAEGYTYQSGTGPQTRVPDNAAIVVAPAAPVVVTPAPATVLTPAPSASAGSSTVYAVPANPPVIATAPAAVASPQWVTQQPAQSGPGAIDKVRPGFDDSKSHSAWDVGTSSAGS